MIQDIVKKRGYYLFDGAFGTYYATRYEETENCEFANLYYPQRVLEIHKEYIEAGCDAIKTNTFSANVQNLDCPFEEVRKILVTGYRLAIEAAQGTSCEVFADIGPFLEQKNRHMFDQIKEVVDVFLEEGAKNFLFETYVNAQGLTEIASYIKERVPDSTIVTSFAVTADGYTRQGLSGKRLLKAMKDCDSVDVYGFNCVCGPMHLHRLLKTLDHEDDLIMIMPNAGYPTILHNRTYFRDNSTYFAEEMKKIVEDGACVIGGCCGTTPSYIKEIRKEVSDLCMRPTLSNKPQEGRVKEENRNELYKKLKRGQRIIAVEFDPPANCDIRKFMNNAEFLREQGIDAITIADCPIARARVDSSLLAAKIRRELGMDVIPHMTCRDRNINATKGLLYGLEIEDVHNVLVITGDPIPAEDRQEVKAVFNFHSQLLASYIQDLNETLFPQPFLIFGALNVNAVNFKQELERAKKKIEHGIQAFMTQPVLSDKGLENLKLAREELNAKILGGILPIVSYRNAEFMNNEVSGIEVDEKYIRLYKDKTREEAAALAVKLSCDIAEKLYPYVDGYYLITPFHRIEIISEIVSHIQKMDKDVEGCYNE